MSGIDQLAIERADRALALAALSRGLAERRDRIQAAMVACPEPTAVDPLETVRAGVAFACAEIGCIPREHDLYLIPLAAFAAADVDGSLGGGEAEQALRLRWRHLTYWDDCLWGLEGLTAAALAKVEAGQ